MILVNPKTNHLQYRCQCIERMHPGHESQSGTIRLYQTTRLSTVRLPVEMVNTPFSVLGRPLLPL